MNLVIGELEEMLDSCEMDGESDGQFAQELRRAISILKEAN